MKRRRQTKIEKNIKQNFMKKSKKQLQIIGLFSVMSSMALPTINSAVQLNASEIKQEAKVNADDSKDTKEIKNVEFLSQEDFNKLKSLKGGKVRFSDGTNCRS